MKSYNIENVKQLLNGSKTALIAVGKASIDSIGSALALSITLNKAGIKSTVFCPEKTDQNYSRLSGIESLTENYSLNDLTISLNYPLNNIDQVSYNDNGGRLNLVVKTKNNSPKVERDQIIVNNQSSIGDINFLFGEEKDLGEKASIVEKGNWVHISPINENKAWAKTSIIDPDAPFSEILTFLIISLGMNIEKEVAKNLLISLRVATQSFSVNVSPETFEAGAICLRSAQVENSSLSTDKFKGQEIPTNKFDNHTPIENIEIKGTKSFSPSASNNNPGSLV
jgi:hypothetical protein